MRTYWMGCIFAAALSTAAIAQDAGKAAPAAPTATPQASPQAAEWKEYEHKEQGMAFSMPHTPETDTQVADTELGKITLYLYTFEKGDAVMTLAVNVYPDKIAKVPADVLLKGGENGAVDGAHGKVTSEKKITIDGNPGLEYQFESAKYHGTCRIYLVGTRMYQLISVSPTGTPFIEETGRFFDSFRLVKP